MENTEYDFTKKLCFKIRIIMKANGIKLNCFALGIEKTIIGQLK